MNNIEKGRDERPQCSCPGTDEQPWDSNCVFHTIGHYHKAGCCELPEDDHRHMSTTEYEVRFPLLFDKKITTTRGTVYRVDMRRFDDGAGLTVSIPFGPEEDDCGLCFDMLGEDAVEVGRLIIEAGRTLAPLKYGTADGDA